MKLITIGPLDLRKTGVLFAAFAFWLSLAGVAHSQTTAFTYQGRLSDGGSSANGQYDFEFKLYNGAATLIGAAVTREEVTVTNGVFLVQLDFGTSPFIPGAAATLEIGVRPGSSTGLFTTLSPRQPITSSPYSIQTINAEKLGGFDASQYVKTDDPRLTDGGPPAPGSEHYIQNTTTQQPNVSFNIGGRGLFGDQVGIGTQTPLAGIRLDVAGAARITPGGSGGNIQFGIPNSETGMTISNPAGRADLRFDGSSFKLLAGPASGGPPSNFSGVAVHTSGDVTVGAAAITGKLSVVESGKPSIYAESNNRGVWGKSTGNSFGVFGESINGLGVQGQSTNNVGVTGASTNHVGVFGSTGAGDVEKPGVLGTASGLNGVGVRGSAVNSGVGVRGDGKTGVVGSSTVANGVGVSGGGPTGVFGVTAEESGTGVRGEANTSNGKGVVGTSTSATGFGVFANNPSGMALGVAGNATQNRDKSGLVKAMIYVNGDGTVRRCYNSQRMDGGAGLPPSGNTGCGFAVSHTTEEAGRLYATVNFGFDVNDRFWSATVMHDFFPNNFGIKTSPGGSSIHVWIYFTDERSGTEVFRDFILIVH